MRGIRNDNGEPLRSTSRRQSSNPVVDECIRDDALADKFSLLARSDRRRYQLLNVSFISLYIARR